MLTWKLKRARQRVLSFYQPPIWVSMLTIHIRRQPEEKQQPSRYVDAAVVAEDVELEVDSEAVVK